jgi:hypothetical protein
MKKSTLPLIMVMVVAILIAAGVGYMLMSAQKVPPQGAPAAETVTAETSATEDPNAVHKQFENLLNELLHTVREKMAAYGEQRKVLIELVQPQNLRDPAYVEENYTMMGQLAMDLHARTAELLRSFEIADTKVGELLAAHPDIDREPILEQWNTTRQKHYNVYNQFFSFEEKIIKEYQDLMSFYRSKKGAYQVDAATGAITFDSPEDRTHVDEVMRRIEDLSAQQRAVLEAGD